METIARIRREHLGKGTPIRKLVRDLKVARNTIRKAVRSDETSFGSDRTVQPRPKAPARLWLWYRTPCGCGPLRRRRAIQDWEQGRRVPDRAARVLLTVIDREPDAVTRALAPPAD